MESESITNEKGQFEVLYRNVINSISNPLFIKDDKHRFVVLNEAVCSFLGMERSELFGKSDYDFFPKHQADVFWEKDNLVLKTGKSNINEEEITNESGEHFTILTSKVRIEDEAGNYYILGTITDISEMKFEEAQLEKKNIQINAQKNEIEGLIKETHRQSEQNLQIISEIIQSLTEKITEEKSVELLDGLNNWVSSMISLHRFFYKSINVSSISLTEYFKKLGGHTLQGARKSVSFNVKGKSVVIPMKLMIPLGLAVNEFLLFDQKNLSSKNESSFISVNVRYSDKILMIDIESDIPVLDKKTDDQKNFRLLDALQILMDQINGSFEIDKKGQLITLKVNQVDAFEKAFFQ